MREIPVFKDTRLLEALDYIDRDLIAEVINDIKAPDADAVPGQSKKAVWRSVKQVLMLAACVVLISAFIPMVSYVIERYDISLGGIFGHSTTEETTVDTPTEHAENPSYPIFTPDLEPISDEMIAELKEVLYQKVYAAEYAAYSKYYASRSDLTDQQKENSSIIIAQDHASFFTSILFSTKKEDHFQGRYYGTISDCVIFAINTYLEDEYNVITIGKTSIINDYSFHIFAYKDGIVKAIETAYSDGWLNADDAEKIRERHNKFNAYGYWKVDEQKEYTYAKFVTDLEEISDKKIEQINNALFKKNYEQEMLNLEKDSDTPEILNERRAKELYARKAYPLAKSQSNMFVVGIKTMDHFINSFRYYGTFGSCVIWASVNNYPPQETVYDLDWVQLTYSAETHVNVYSNGKIYDLQEAFDKGILDIDNVRKLYHRYLTYEAYLLSDRTAPILAFSEDKSAEEIYTEAKAGNFVVFNDAFVTAGEDIWNSFYEKCSSGMPAAVNIVNYYPSRSAIYLTAIVYNRGQFEKYTEARSGGYINLLYSKYKHIIKYDGAILDKNDTVYDHEETYILVNDNTLTYPKIKESGTSINHYVAFSKLSRVNDTPVSFNITPEQEAIITEIFGHYYSHNEGHWKYWFDEILTLKEAEIWNHEAPSNIISILDFLSSNSRFYRLWRSSGSSSSDSKINHVEITPEQDAIITELVPDEYKCYAGYWDIWFYKMLYSIETKEWNSTQPATSSEIQQLMEKFNIYNRLTTNVPIYP